MMKIGKKILINELKIFPNKIEALQFDDGCLSACVPDSGAIICTKTVLSKIKAQIPFDVYRKFLKGIYCKSFFIKPIPRHNSRSIEFKNGSLCFNIYAKEIIDLTGSNLYAGSLNILPCPFDVVLGIQAVIETTAKDNLFSYYKQINCVHLKNDWVVSFNGSLLSRYQLTSKMPFEMMIEAETIKSILSKIKYLKLTGIAKLKTREINGYVLSFEKHRIFLPKGNDLEIESEKIERAWLNKLTSTEEKDIYRGAMQSRGFINSLDTNRCNMVTRVNSFFSSPCKQIHFIKGKIHGQFPKLSNVQDETVTLSFQKNLLKFSLDSIKLRFNGVCQTLTYGGKNETNSIKVNASDFIRLIKNHSLIGLSIVTINGIIVRCLIIKNDAAEHLLPERRII